MKNYDRLRAFSLALFLVLGSLVFGGKVFAATQIDQQQTGAASANSGSWHAQTFMPTVNNINRIDIKSAQYIGSDGYSIIVCEGAFPGDLSFSGNCPVGTNFVATTSGTLSANVDTVVTMYLPSGALHAGTPAFFVFHTNNYNFRTSGSNSYSSGQAYYRSSGSGGVFVSEPNDDYYFKTYYDDTLSVNIVTPFATTTAFTMNAKNPVKFYYDFCAQFDQINDATVFLDKIEGGTNNILGNQYVTLVRDKTSFVGPQSCSGSFTLYYDTSNDVIASGQLAAEIWLNQDVGTTTYLFSAPVVYTIGNAANYIRAGDVSPVTFEVSASSTYQLHAIYNLTGLSWATSSICYYNESGNNSGLCATPTAATGFVTINWPNNGITNIGTLDFRGYFSSPDYPLLKSGMFVTRFVGQTFITDTQGVFGTSTHWAACSNDEWNSTSTFLGLNLIYMKCTVIESFLSLGEKIGKAPAAAANGFVYLFRGTFPVNIFSHFKESWDDSAGQSLPAVLAPFDIIDTDGNVQMTTPTFGSVAGQTIVIWGPGVFQGNSAMIALAAALRYITGILFWYLFIKAIYELATNTIEEIDNP